jgi:hypothetical protein
MKVSSSVKRQRLHELKYDIRILFNFVAPSEDERIVLKDILLPYHKWK